MSDMANETCEEHHDDRMTNELAAFNKIFVPESAPFEIKYGPFGRYVVATRDIANNEVILDDKSFLSTTRYEAKEFVCTRCLIDIGNDASIHTFWCAMCGAAHYCSRECRDIDEPLHDWECRVYEKMASTGVELPSSLMITVRDTLRLISIMKAEARFIGNADIAAIKGFREIPEKGNISIEVDDPKPMGLLPDNFNILDVVEDDATVKDLNKGAIIRQPPDYVEDLFGKHSDIWYFWQLTDNAEIASPEMLRAVTYNAEFLVGLIERTVFESFPRAFIASLMMRVSSNIFNFSGYYSGAPTSRSLYVAGSFFNHSCDPNAGVSRIAEREIFANQTKKDYYTNYQFRALKDIAAGDEINISYIGASKEGRAERRKHLKEHYFFDCICSLCDAEK